MDGSQEFCDDETQLGLSNSKAQREGAIILVSSYINAIRLQDSNPIHKGSTTITSTALDIAALCLSSWPAAISAQMLMLVSTSIRISPQHESLRCQLTADDCKMIIRFRYAWHCSMAQHATVYPRPPNHAYRRRLFFSLFSFHGLTRFR